MKTAIITVTENGGRTAQKLYEASENADIFCFCKYPVPNGNVFEHLSDLVERIWNYYDAFVFISACGIAVRAVAPHIVSKVSDPAVVAVDDSCKYAVALLSGHLGGANDLAEKIGNITGAVPVITTATDRGGRFSPDSFAKANELIITDMNAAKLIAAASLRGEKTGLCSDYECINIPDFITAGKAGTGICISTDINRKPFDITLNLIPKNVIIGAGCRKNASYDSFEKNVYEALDNNGIDRERISILSTIDIKKDEPALTEFAGKHSAEFIYFTAEELMAQNGEFSSSEFVLKTTGADNVCERSIAACGGEVIAHKLCGDGVTCAIGEKSIVIDFNRRTGI